ncbi:retrovirus-related pol polyprotein from transposon TNT 1-94 [Tanacetum coccineum]
MDSIIPLGQKNTLAEYMILSGADNRPPIEQGRMILESVENGPLIWPTVEENGMTGTKKYAELSAAEKIQADYDIKAMNIILQGLPADIYSHVNHHRVAKDLWERGESLHKYYLRFTHLINDMNIYNINLEQFQVNTKFLNSLPPEWSKCVTDVKLVKDLHTTTFDQLHAYLEQHELHANEVRLLRERNQDPLAFMANQQMTPPYFNTYQSSYNNPQLQQQFPPSQYGSIHPNQHYSSTYPSQPQFNHSSVQPSYLYQSQMNHKPHLDDPIACLNKAMAFLMAVTSSRFPSTNNQLRTSSNPRNQATIQDGSVIVRVVECYNCQGKGHMAKQCTQPKRPRNAAWYKDTAMLAEAQEAGQMLNEEQLAFLADPGVPDGQAIQTIIPNNAAFQTEDLDTYDSDCDDISNAKAVLMDNIFNYGSDVILEEKANKEQNNESVTADLERYNERVKTFEQRLNIDLSCRKKMIDSQMDDMIKEKLELKEQVDSLEQNISKQIKEKECLLQTFTVFKSESKEKEAKYMENEIDLEKKIKELDDIIFKVGQSAQTMHMLTKTQAFYDNIHKQALGYQNLVYLEKAQRIKPTLYDGRVISAKHVAIHFGLIDEGKLTTPDARTKVKGKEIVDIVAQIPSSYTIVPGMFKLDLEPLDPSAKKVVVTPKNNVKKVRFAEPLTSSSNIKQVESSTTSDSNTPVLAPAGLKCSNSNCRSKPTGNKKNDRISRTPSRNMINKVEAQPRKVNKKNRVVEPIRNVDDKHSLLNANSEPICATCRTFTIVGNSCPLTRITSTNVVPPKKTTSHSVETEKTELKVYSRKPKNVKNVVQIVLWYLDSECSKHMTGNRSQLMNFVSKFRGTVRFGKDHIARIMGYGDYQLGNVTISRVYYVEGLGHNLFSVGQFCDADLEVAFRKNTCFIHNLEGVDLLSGSRDTNLYTISLDDMLKTSPICLLSKALKTKSWLWHRRLSHLNFGTLNKLAKYGLARDIPRLKFQKDHLCSACALGKSKKSSHQPKAEDINQEKL